MDSIKQQTSFLRVNQENRVQLAQWARKESRWVGLLVWLWIFNGCVPICMHTVYYAPNIYFAGDGKDSTCKQIVSVQVKTN